MREFGRPGHLRERPPTWPRRSVGDDSDSPRWLREPEPFENDALPELYPGALIMDDLPGSLDDVATIRILARYTVVRVLLFCIDGSLTGSRLRVERRIALEHLALLPQHDWERRALERLALLCREAPTSEIIDAITVSAEAAAKRSQAMGAFTLYRTAYELSLREQWWGEAAQAAYGVGQLALLEEAHRSARLWRRRAAVLDRRAIRAERDAAADRREQDGGPPAGDASSGS